MRKNVPVFFILLFVFCAISGCSRSEQKMKIPEIKLITIENVHGVIAPDDNNIWITGAYGSIHHSEDAGLTWVSQDSGEEETIIVDGVFLNRNVGWLVGNNGTILHTKNSGKTWVRQKTGTKKHLFSISFVDQNYGWACGDWNTVIHTEDGGLTWTPQSEEFDKSLNNIFFVDRQNGWLVGERGILKSTTDGGLTWSDQRPQAFIRESFEEELENPPPTLYGVFFTDNKNGFACGIGGTIIRTADSGKKWEVLPAVTEETLYTLVIKGKKGWAIGDKGAYLMSSDGGLTWRNEPEAIKSKQPFRDIYFTSETNGWAVGGGGSVTHTEDGGLTWEFYSGLSYAMEFFKMPKGLEFGGGVE